MSITVEGARRRPATRWISAPWLFCAGATLLLATPVRLLGLQAPEPVFALAPAFAWATLRPSLIAPAALLSLGLFMDLLWGAPLGLWSICLLTAHAFALSVRRFLSGEDFAVLWVWYGGACAAAFAAGLAATTLASGVVPSPLGVLGQWAASVALFPLAHALIDRYQVTDARFR